MSAYCPIFFLNLKSSTYILQQNFGENVCFERDKISFSCESLSEATHMRCQCSQKTEIDLIYLSSTVAMNDALKLPIMCQSKLQQTTDVVISILI